MDSLALADAVLARLTGLTGVVVSVADVPSTPVGGYAVIWPDAGLEWSDSFDGTVGAQSTGFAVTCAGWSPEQALNTLRLVSGRLRGWRPDTSPSAGPLRQTDGSPLTRDDQDPADVRWFAVRFYTIETTTP